MKKLKVIVLASLFMAVPVAYAEYDLPSSRKTTWNPGIPGGIPSRSYDVGTDIDVKDYGATGNGTTDDTTAIRNAINACTGDCDVVYMPAGVYRITGGLSLHSNMTLRGAGPENTEIHVDTSSGGGIFMGGAEEHLSGISITSGYDKGSTSLTLSNASSFDVGDYVIIRQDDGTNPDVVRGDCAWWKDNVGGQYHSIGQANKITAKNGNTITLESPLHYQYSSPYNPDLSPMGVSGNGARIEYAGAEDLYIKRLQRGGASTFYMGNAAYCWGKNIEVDNGYGRIVHIQRCYRCVFRDSYVHHASGGYDSGAGAYGIVLSFYTADSLIENNIGCYGNGLVILEVTGGGNVIGYNYLDSSWLEHSGAEYVQIADVTNHCSTPHYDLFEGNMITKFGQDAIHGNAIYTTVFRNNFDVDHSWICESHPYDDTRNRAPYEIRRDNYYMSFIGNISHKPGDSIGNFECGYTDIGQPHCSYDGPDVVYRLDNDSKVYDTLLRHGNYDYARGQFEWADPDHNLPNSLYLTSKPSWWDDQGAGRPWPSIGPDVQGYVIDIPAKDRYEGGMYGPPSPPSNLRTLSSLF